MMDQMLKKIAMSPLVNTAAAAIFLAVLLGGSMLPANAQSSQNEERSAMRCMIRILPDETTFPIIVQASNTSAMRAQGYEATPCRNVFPTAESRERWRDQICQITSTWRDELQRNFEEVRGVRPAVLCGMAEQAVGQWQRVESTAPVRDAN
mgnify:CR=1 FL=1